MNLVIANTNATAFAVSRALNCTDRTEVATTQTTP